MTIDPLGECDTVVQIFRLLDSLKEILEKSPGAGIFVTGRPHIRPEIETRVPRQAASVSVGPTTNDVARFLRFRIREDETPDTIDSCLEADIPDNTPENISEICVTTRVLRT